VRPEALRRLSSTGCQEACRFRASNIPACLPTGISASATSCPRRIGNGLPTLAAMKIRCFGMTDALLARLAQHNPHLAKQGVGSGDVFLFFGLFAELASNDRHHRIFGYLNVEKVVKIGAQPSSDELEGTPRRHPHTIAKWDSDEKRWDPNNTIYLGRGRKAKKAHEALRLTKPGGPPSHWVVPDWLRETGLLTIKTPCAGQTTGGFAWSVVDKSLSPTWATGPRRRSG
jgi:Nucleotide modification associated domain 3